MDIEDILLHEMRQIPYNLTYMWNLKNPNSNRTDWWLSKDEGRGVKWVKVVKRYRLLVIR